LKSQWGRIDEESSDSHADGLGFWSVQHAGPASGAKQRLGRWIDAQIGFPDETGSLVAASSPSLRLGPPPAFAHA
jgi:hypothetical protein